MITLLIIVYLIIVVWITVDEMKVEVRLDGSKHSPTPFYWALITGICTPIVIAVMVLVIFIVIPMMIIGVFFALLWIIKTFP